MAPAPAPGSGSGSGSAWALAAPPLAVEWAAAQCKGSRPVMRAAAVAAGPCSSKGKRTTIQAPTAAVPSRTRSGAARRTRRRVGRPPSQQQQLKPCRRSCLDDGRPAARDATSSGEGQTKNNYYRGRCLYIMDHQSATYL